ncbi:MAG: T9SS type A sorting domain-containing protein [Bacteroidota bacterium]|nr:T9SS type A sorting domain-containing protein [Bacteroidota bacterium]
MKTNTGYDYVTVNYKNNGQRQWIATYNNTEENRNEGIFGMAVDKFGNTFVTGYSDDRFGIEFCTVKFDSFGQISWVDRYHSLGNLFNFATDIEIDNEGAVYVTGTSQAGHWFEGVHFISLIKYIDKPKFCLSADSINLNPVEVGCTASETVFVKNEGKQTLYNVSIQSNSSSFKNFPSSISIPPLDSVPVTITFAPTDTGLFVGEIVFLYLSKSEILQLSGIGNGDKKGIQVPVQLGENWQLISIPVITKCPPVIQPLFGYHNSYVLRDSLSKGYGYWHKFKTPSITFTGFQFIRETVYVDGRWNIIGSLSYPISIYNLTSLPENIIISPIYEYNNVGYTMADSIKPGRGYWVKVKQNGQLILDTESKHFKPITNSRVFVESSNKIIFKDAIGIKRILYFQTSLDDSTVEILDFELPPIAPTGIFDVRFASGKMLEIVEHNNSKELPIRISYAQYPLMIEFKLRAQEGKYLLKVDNSEIPIQVNGSNEITNPQSQISLLFQGFSTLPDKYSLEQNYPNPFNPTTKIRYQLPVKSKIILKIYNLLGSEINILVDEIQEGGYKSIEWDATNSKGLQVPSGIYFYHIHAGIFNDVKKMLLLR